MLHCNIIDGALPRSVKGFLHEQRRIQDMSFNAFIARTKDTMAKRRRYNAMVNEIMQLTPRDLADINGNREEMLHHVRKEVFGF